MRGWIVALAVALSACATTPGVVDKRALAGEVFALSGGLGDARQALKFAAPAALGQLDDIGARCRRSIGQNASILSVTACDMVESLLRSSRAGASDYNALVDTAIAKLEARGADAMVATYTTEELIAMRRYYSSPEGRAIVAKRADFWRALVTGGEGGGR